MGKATSEAEAHQIVGGDESLMPGRELAALHRVAKQRPGDTPDPQAGYRHEVHGISPVVDNFGNRDRGTRSTHPSQQLEPVGVAMSRRRAGAARMFLLLQK